MVHVEKSSTHFYVWCLSTLLLIFSLSYEQEYVSNRNLYRVKFSTSVGILLMLWQRLLKSSPWLYALLTVRCALKQNLYFPAAYCDLPTEVCTGGKRERKKSRRYHYDNLAFGGRGPPYMVCGSKKFDSTLGYPGEGWQKLLIATWNTRSLTYERFDYCNSLQYDILAIAELW